MPDGTLDQRILHPSMEYYRHVYAKSKRWNGENLDGKTIVIYCEQGFGDIIQFARYFPQIGEYNTEFVRNCQIYLHCPVELHTLFSRCDLFQDMLLLDKQVPMLPAHDYHVLSMSLPFILEKCDLLGPAHYFVPYICPVWPYHSITNDKVKSIGICWEGSPGHIYNRIRSMPLRHFKRIQDLGYHLYCLQKQVHNYDLCKNCQDIDLLGVELPDWYETARLIREMDAVISVDTGVLHLAGAMGKRCYGLITDASDGRFEELRPIEGKYVNRVSRWYPDMRILKKEPQNGWTDLFDLIEADLL